jgi:hypothetical protein
VEKIYGVLKKFVVLKDFYQDAHAPDNDQDAQ